MALCVVSLWPPALAAFCPSHHYADVLRLALKDSDYECSHHAVARHKRILDHYT